MAYLVLALFMVSSFFVPFSAAREYSVKYSALTKEEISAAEFLNDYDPYYRRVITDIDNEVLFAQIAGKLPMDARISDLEAYSPAYKKQLEDRKKIISENSYFPIPEYSIAYVVKKDCRFNVIYDKGNVRICKSLIS